MDDLLCLTSSWWCWQVCSIYQKWTRLRNIGRSKLSKSSCWCATTFHGDPETRIQFGMICNYLCVPGMLHISLSCAPHLKLAAENDLFEEEIWNLGHVQDRYDKMGVENIYIYTCRYVSMYLCIFYIEYSFHTDIRYPSISIYTKVCGHPNVCKHSAQIWALCDRGELRCGTTDLGKSKKSLYRTRCDDISLGNLTVISILSRISRMLVVYVMTGVFFCLNVGIHRWSMLARCCCNWWTDEPILQIHLSHKKKLVVKGI